MNQPNPIDVRIVKAFQHIYPHLPVSRFWVEHREDETIAVHVEDQQDYRAVIHSDDDGFLRFTPFDEDDPPEQDDHDFISIRVRILDDLGDDPLGDWHGRNQ